MLKFVGTKSVFSHKQWKWMSTFLPLHIEKNLLIGLENLFRIIMLFFLRSHRIEDSEPFRRVRLWWETLLAKISANEIIKMFWCFYVEIEIFEWFLKRMMLEDIVWSCSGMSCYTKFCKRCAWNFDVFASNNFKCLYFYYFIQDLHMN